MKNILLILSSIFVILVLNSCSKSDMSGTANADGGAGVGGSLARFTINGDYLYIVNNTNLRTYNISNPANPEFVSQVIVGTGIETIYPYKGKLFIGSNRAMYIYSLATPGTPQLEGEASHIRACDPVVANDNYAFVTVRSGVSCGGVVNALLIYDLTSLATPQLIHTTNLSNPHGLGLKNDILYVCDAADGLKIFNVSNGYSPVKKKTISGYTFKDVIVYGDILIVKATEGMVIYDITNPLEPSFVKLIN